MHQLKLSRVLAAPFSAVEEHSFQMVRLRRVTRKRRGKGPAEAQHRPSSYLDVAPQRYPSCYVSEVAR